MHPNEKRVITALTRLVKVTATAVRLLSFCDGKGVWIRLHVVRKCLSSSKSGCCWMFCLTHWFPKTKFRGLSLQAKYTDRATAACRRKLVPHFTDRKYHVVSVTDPYGSNLSFLDRSSYFFFQVAPQLYSRGWLDPIPDPLLLRKSGSAGNRTRTSGYVARNSALGHRGGLLSST
jgi:hypothetical protein